MVDMLVAGVIGVFEVERFGENVAERRTKGSKEVWKSVGERSVRAGVALERSSALVSRTRMLSKLVLMRSLNLEVGSEGSKGRLDLVSFWFEKVIARYWEQLLGS